MAKKEPVRVEGSESVAIVTAAPHSFSYDNAKAVKCAFTMVLDNTIWTNFCAASEELRTSPSYLLFLLMERYLLTTGKLPGDYRAKHPAAASEPIVVRVEDIQNTPGSFGLGKNKLLQPEQFKKPKEEDMDALDLGDLND